jgi:predicted chitinase
MSTITIKIKLETSSQLVTFNDYNSIYPAKYNTDGGEDKLFAVVEKTITNWYNTKLEKYYSSPKVSFSYNDQTLSGDLVFLESEISNGLSLVVSEAKAILQGIFKDGSTQKNDIPKKPDFYLSNDDFVDDVNYEIVYSINEPIQLEPQPVESDNVDTNTPDPTPEQEFEDNLNETSTSNQEQGREERTSENINSTSNNNPAGDPVSPGVQNVIKNEIKAKKIAFDTPANESEREEIAESLGVLPFLWYNSYQIDYIDIQFLELSISNGLPTLKTTFFDTFNKMKDEGFPLDDTKISLFLNPRSQVLKPIHLDFKIINFSVSGNSYTVTGLIDVPKLYIKEYKSISKKTSYNALQDIAKDCKLGFNSNIDDTNDQMTWINTGDRNLDFIENITEVSYKSDETFLISYIDYYYNLNYVDLEKELNRDLRQELGIGNVGLEEILKVDNKETVKSLILTNDASQKEGNNYFSSYRIINNSTLVSLREGYYTTVKYYDQLTKDFLVFDVDSITTKGNSKIVLKGAPQDEEFFKQNTNLIYTGKMDSDNTHKNYNYSYVQNMRNIVDLEKICLEINMATPNYNLYRFQKILLLISNQTPTPSADMINNRLSGEWMIISISFKFDGSSFSQIIKLVKRELELSSKEYDNELQSQPKQEEGQSTSNDNDDVNNTQNPSEPNPDVAQQNTNQTADDDDFPLTKQMWEAIYRGRLDKKVVQLYYQPLKEVLIQYDIKSKERIAAFLSQVNTETGFLVAVSEYGDGSQYEGRANDLGNTQPGDGRKFKGRGLIQLTGRTNYQNASKFFRKDFINNPTQVAADNKTHQRGAATSEQIRNSILTAVKFWLNSPRKNLNVFADRMSIKEEMGLGSASITDLPHYNNEGKKYGRDNNKNFATAFGGNKNLLNLTIISLAVNGGYNGYDERVKNWIRIRNIIK